MMFLVFKVLVSALVVGGINVVARTNPAVGGWIAALPILSILSVIWLASDGASGQDLSAFVSRVLFGLVPTAVLLGIIAACLARGLPLPGALAAAAGAWGLFTVAASRFGLLG